MSDDIVVELLADDLWQKDELEYVQPLCRRAAAQITALREQLVARDAEIAAWLREEAHELRAEAKGKGAMAGAALDFKADGLKSAATAIEARSALPLRRFEPANYIKSPEDLAAYREAAIEAEVAAIVAWLRSEADMRFRLHDEQPTNGGYNHTRGIAVAMAADGIEARAYVKENGDG